MQWQDEIEVVVVAAIVEGGGSDRGRGRGDDGGFRGGRGGGRGGGTVQVYSSVLYWDFAEAP